MITINIPIVIWGEKYIRNFEEYTYKNLILEIEKHKDFYKNVLINLIICTKKKSFQKFKVTFDDRGINLILLNIDFLISKYENKEFDKYLLLKAVQQGIFYKYKNNGIFILLYPDFIWKLGSLKFVIEKIHQKKVVLAYCPQSISENLLNKDFNQNFLENNFVDYLVNNMHPIVTNNQYNEKLTSFSTGASVIFDIEGGYAFRNFHLHPIAIDFKKFSDNDFLNPITVSLDEDFIANLNLNNEDYFIPNSSSQMIFSSLLGIDEINLPKMQKNNFESYYNWVELYAQKIHINFSKNLFILGNKNIEIENIKERTNKLFNYIYKRLEGSNLSKFSSENYISFVSRQIKHNKYSLNLKFYLNNLHFFYMNKFNNKEIGLNLGYEQLRFSKKQKEIVNQMVDLFYD